MTRYSFLIRYFIFVMAISTFVSFVELSEGDLGIEKSDLKNDFEEPGVTGVLTLILKFFDFVFLGVFSPLIPGWLTGLIFTPPSLVMIAIIIDWIVILIPL